MKIFLLVMLCLPGMVIAQQSASISGYITNAETGETLIAANIGLLNTTLGTPSNRSGFYSITKIEPGAYTLITSYIGYQTFKKEIILKPGQDLRLDINLVPSANQLQSLVVEADSREKENIDIGVSSVDVELIKSVPAVFEADVFRSLQMLPGVKASSDFSSGLYIRGGSPDQTLILLDKTTVYNPTHFFGFFSTFNPDAIKDVRLYKGGYPAQYGGRLGSVLTIYNKDGNRKEFAGTATLGLLASRATVEGPFKNGSWMLALRRSTLEPLLAILRQSQDNIPSTFYFYDINGKVNYDVNANNRLSLAFYSGTDYVDFSFADDANVVLDYGNQTVSANWSHIFSEKLFSDFTLTGSRYFSFPAANIANTTFERPNNIYDFSLKSDIEYYPANNHKISTGFWAGSITLKLKTRFDGDEVFKSRIQSYYASLYAQDEWDISERWKLTTGLRASGFGRGSYLRLAPRASVEYRLTDAIQLQAAYGRYYQYLTQMTAGIISSGFNTWLTTADGVPPSYGDQFVLGAKTAPWKGYGLDVEIYYRTMRDLFELDPFLPDPAGLDYSDRFRFGKGYAYGVEVFFEKKLGRLTGFLGYTFSVTRRKFPGFNHPIGQNTDARYFPPKYDRSHDIEFILNYELSNRWSSSLVFHYATGQAYTRVLGRTAAIDFPTNSQPVDQLIVGKVNASRLPAYHRLDIGFTRKGTLFGWATAKWQFQLVNVYSHRNVWFYNYDLEENPAQMDAVRMLPILPNVSYTINF